MINFEFLLNCWLDTIVLTSGKPFVTFDVDFKHFGQNIQTLKIFWKKVTFLPTYFTIEKSLLKIFLHRNVLFVNQFSKFFFPHILRQTYYLVVLLKQYFASINYPRKFILKRQNLDIRLSVGQCSLFWNS